MKKHINGDVRPSLLSDPRPAPPTSSQWSQQQDWPWVYLQQPPRLPDSPPSGLQRPAAFGKRRKREAWDAFCAAKTEDFWLVVWAIWIIFPFSWEWNNIPTDEHIIQRG